MRNSTIKKLFDSAPQPSEDEPLYRLLWDAPTLAGDISCVLILESGKLALIQEFKHEADGFDVYVRSEGNSVPVAQHDLGLISDEIFRDWLQERNGPKLRLVPDASKEDSQ